MAKVVLGLPGNRIVSSVNLTKRSFNTTMPSEKKFQGEVRGVLRLDSSSTTVRLTARMTNGIDIAPRTVVAEMVSRVRETSITTGPSIVGNIRTILTVEYTPSGLDEGVEVIPLTEAEILGQVDSLLSLLRQAPTGNAESRIVLLMNSTAADVLV